MRMTDIEIVEDMDNILEKLHEFEGDKIDFAIITHAAMILYISKKGMKKDFEEFRHNCIYLMNRLIRDKNYDIKDISKKLDDDFSPKLW
jgi:hypothetical protein